VNEQLPVFGPTETFGGIDETEPAVAIVQFAIALTRTQLATALGISFAEIAADQTLESLTDTEVRVEVEGHLATEALHSLDVQIERDQARRWAPDQQQLLAQIADLAARAYTRPAPQPLEPQRPRYGTGTVTLRTLDRGEVTVTEPAWCIGHDNDHVGHYADITHTGTPTSTTASTARHGDVEVFYGQVSHAPHREADPEPLPTLYVALDLNASVDTKDGRSLSRALRLASARLDRTLNDLARMRGEQP
jgi:hypothetical protein